ncbi:MAG: hypothetical protein K2K58_11975 [Muribaculaceae bacterium]|nr:hypothetical protein [Muribaculaceae bacterium]
MAYIFKSKVSSLLLISASLFAGCSQTDIIGSKDSPNLNGDVISLTLSAPEIQTRADASHKLRYTAKLLKGNVDKGDIELVQKKQIIEGATNTLVFEGVEEGVYTITLFADYIPIATQPDADGVYPDVYYDTSATEDIEMKSVGKTIINNDNYDCFGTYIVLTKEAEEKRESISLPRIVSKIRLTEKEPVGAETPTKVSITNFSTFMSYKLTTGTASNPYNSVYKVDGGKWDVSPSDAASKELFYFYSFSTSNYKDALGQLIFSVEADGLTPVETAIAGGDIEIRPNYQITVKGNFIPRKPEDPLTRTDRILIDVSTISDWKNSD